MTPDDLDSLSKKFHQGDISAATFVEQMGELNLSIASLASAVSIAAVAIVALDAALTDAKGI